MCFTSVIQVLILFTLKYVLDTGLDMLDEVFMCREIRDYCTLVASPPVV